MIVQAIGLLDDLDKELNTYAMRVREWYGWHFPEMGKIVTDNIKYAQVVSASTEQTLGIFLSMVQMMSLISAMQWPKISERGKGNSTKQI